MNAIQGAMRRVRLLRMKMAKNARRRRTRRFIRELGPSPGDRILDVGGSEEYWAGVDLDLHVTLLNLEKDRTRIRSNAVDYSSRVHFDSVAGNGCDLSEYETDSFEIVFSNSVIEHVGDDKNVSDFASELQRVGRKHWIQTPARVFPIEAHTYLPFYWYYPARLRRWIASRIDQKHAGKPWFQCPISETRGLSRRHLSRLFPNSNCYMERFFGWPKSYSFFGDSSAT
jgi:hypothetical protein